MKLLFEKHVPGSNFFRFPLQDLPEIDLQETLPEEHWRETELGLPELSEIESTRHFTALAKRMFDVDDGSRPIGSCVANRRSALGEYAARLDGFARVHPSQPVESIQGALELLYELGAALSEIGGMSAFALQGAPNLRGEFAGLAIIRAYFKSRGQDVRRRVVLVPETSRDANLATAASVGYSVRVVKSTSQGRVDVDDFHDQLDDDVAAIILTNPNALGLFESDVLEITESAHEIGALAYCDGANLNAIAGIARPGDMGFDVVHYDLHKAFSIPCGSCGGSVGAIGVKRLLEPFLPSPVVVKSIDGDFELDYDRPKSIGKFEPFYGNFGGCVRAYAYILSLGCEGLKRASQHAVLNANYVRTQLAGYYDFPFPGLCKREFVCVPQKLEGKRDASQTSDFAERLSEFGRRPPTASLPLISDDSVMIASNETETKERLDDFIAALKQLAKERVESPEALSDAPCGAANQRVDETQATVEPSSKREEPCVE